MMAIRQAIESGHGDSCLRHRDQEHVILRPATLHSPHDAGGRPKDLAPVCAPHRPERTVGDRSFALRLTEHPQVSPGRAQDDMHGGVAGNVDGGVAGTVDGSMAGGIGGAAGNEGGVIATIRAVMRSIDRVLRAMAPCRALTVPLAACALLASTVEAQANASADTSFFAAERMAALSAAERAAWERYLAASRQRMRAERDSMAAEVRAAGLAERTPAPSGPNFMLKGGMTR
ncbi:MAG: hypothetical protein ACJ8J0_17085, partial [Longimicrobiaceae bacterium]